MIASTTYLAYVGKPARRSFATIGLVVVEAGGYFSIAIRLCAFSVALRGTLSSALGLGPFLALLCS